MSEMLKAFKTRLYPTAEQAAFFEQNIGNCRFVYNYALGASIQEYKASKKNFSKFEMMKRITQLKKEEGKKWLKLSDSISLQASIEDLDKAYQGFFKEGKGFPNFHKKGLKDSYTTKNARMESRHHIFLPKIGGVKTKERLQNGEVRRATVSKRAGLYFVSILYTSGEMPKSKSTQEVGVDLGVKDFAILSDGTRIANPKYLKQCEKRLAVLQKRLSRKQKGSKNREKAKLNVARLHLHISFMRGDFLHKTSSAIAKQYSYIAIENLNIGGMVKNHHLAQSISDASWGEFVRQLEYKSSWYGTRVKKIGRFEPSSKTCHRCAYVKTDLTLEERAWDCPKCGSHLDRDLNAAMNNILAFSKKPPMDSRGVSLEDTKPVESSAIAGTVKQENLEVSA